MHRVLFQIGPVTLYSYGFFISLGFLIAALLAMREAKKEGIAPAVMLDALMAVLFGGLIGGRALFVGVNFAYYLENPLGIFALWEGGLAIQGALAGGIIGGILASRVKKISFLKISDIAAPYIPIAQAFGRVGCFMNGCCYGEKRVPVQLYSSLALLLLSAILLFIKGKGKFRDGYLFGWYFVLYSIARFCTDFLRIDTPPVFYGLKLSQILGIFIFFSGAILIMKASNNGKIRI